MNTYSYAAANPVQLIDPRGLQWVIPNPTAPPPGITPGRPLPTPNKPEPFFLEDDDAGGSSDGGAGKFARCKMLCDAKRYFDHFMCRLYYQLLQDDEQLFILCNKGARYKWDACVAKCEQECL